MNQRAVLWSPNMEPLGRCAAAIGVFDGVHLGHRELLEETVRDSVRREARAVGITFDRDPDQVVTPESAAPQLMSLDDKIDAMLSMGLSRVVVVPFTPEMAATEPEAFLEQVVEPSMDVVAVHVGQDFRFGARASGDIDTLYVWGVEHNVEIVAHQLVTSRSQPVTSTRIRGLIAIGDVDEAAALLGRSHRVRGVVVRGRGEGEMLGFPTANVEPAPYSAVPGTGVYAGIAHLEDGSAWPAAISVGLPPSFPQATDYLEAHLIGLDEDIYDLTVELDFVARLRAQMRFDDTGALSAAIAADVAAVDECLRAHGLGQPQAPQLPDGAGEIVSPLIDDPVALDEAQRGADKVDAMTDYERADGSWVAVMHPVRMSGIITAAGSGSFAYAAALQAAGVPYAWDPYPPEEMPGFRPAIGAFDRPFTMLVPADRRSEARAALRDAGLIIESDDTQSDPSGRPGVPAGAQKGGARTPVTGDGRRVFVWVLLVFIAFDLLVAMAAWIMGLFG